MHRILNKETSRDIIQCKDRSLRILLIGKIKRKQLRMMKRNFKDFKGSISQTTTKIHSHTHSHTHTNPNQEKIFNFQSIMQQVS